jgi:hypothetical protein
MSCVWGGRGSQGRRLTTAVAKDLVQVAALRLRAQRLIGKPFASALDAIRSFGAVQAQDYGAAKWALGQRTVGATDAELDRLFHEGAILRTHVMRPTWHFVLPEDVGWLLELTGPRVRAGLRWRHQQLELDADVIARAHTAFAAALAGGRHLTRGELGEILRAAGIEADGPRLAHLILLAELDRLIVSGRRKGKAFTYTLFEERAPSTLKMERTEALVELALRYFRSHGPAQLQDFVWWSGLTTGDARAGIALAGDALERRVAGGAEYWLDAPDEAPPKASSVAHLLPNFDEYTVAYRDRSALVDPSRPFDRAFFAHGGVISNVLAVGGRVEGRWRRTTARGRVRLEVDLLPTAKTVPEALIAKAGRRMRRFLESPVELALRR